MLGSPCQARKLTNAVPPTKAPLLHEFADVFTQPIGLPPTRSVEHHINLISGASLPNTPYYHLAPREAAEIECQIDELLTSGHIQPSSSPCASPTFIIPKKDTFEWRLVTDYRALNKVTVKNHYTLPLIDDLLDHLHGACFFTKMDLTTSYHQVRMHATNTWKNDFKTNFGLFEWLVMSFGVTNALATFMRFINDIFREHLGKFVVIYLDDILVFSKSQEYPIQDARTILELLQAHHLQFKEKKSYFGQTSVQYLGFIIDSIGVHPYPSCVQALV